MSEPVIKSKTEMDRLQIYAELDRLRAENAELRQLLQTIATRLQVAGGAFPTLIDAIRAKTAKEGE